MMAAIKAQLATGREIKRILNGGVPKAPPAKVPLYISIAIASQIDALFSFKSDQALNVNVSTARIEVCDFPGRSKPSVEIAAGPTVAQINGISPSFVQLNQWKFGDCFR